jgi:hypothetical protein
MLSDTLPYEVPVAPSPARILVASLVGTTIEFLDFYIYATAAVLVFPKLFFTAAIRSVGLYMSASAIVSLLALMAIRPRQVSDP